MLVQQLYLPSWCQLYQMIKVEGENNWHMFQQTRQAKAHVVAMSSSSKLFNSIDLPSHLKCIHLHQLNHQPLKFLVEEKNGKGILQEEKFAHINRFIIEIKKETSGSMNSRTCVLWWKIRENNSFWQIYYSLWESNN